MKFLLLFKENQVKGLEKDETDFLDFVSTRQEELLVAREKEDSEVLAEYRVSLCFVEVCNLLDVSW